MSRRRKKDACEGPWEFSIVQSVWFRKDKAKNKRQADSWLKRHGFEPSLKTETSKEGYLVARLHEPGEVACYRYGEWMDDGRVRFLYGGKPDE